MPGPAVIETTSKGHSVSVIPKPVKHCQAGHWRVRWESYSNCRTCGTGTDGLRSVAMASWPGQKSLVRSILYLLVKKSKSFILSFSISSTNVFI